MAKRKHARQEGASSVLVSSQSTVFNMAVFIDGLLHSAMDGGNQSQQQPNLPRLVQQTKRKEQVSRRCERGVSGECER